MQVGVVWDVGSFKRALEHNWQLGEWKLVKQGVSGEREGTPLLGVLSTWHAH